jgi:ABC-2 type transport system ATP-binding protein
MIRTHDLTRHFTVKKETVKAVTGLDLHVRTG